MRVRIVSIEGCGGTAETIKRVTQTAADLGIAIECEHIVVSTPQEATLYRHLGSPTVQINGRDIEPEARPITRFGLT